MALKITLKANERMIIGGAVVTNGNSRSDLVIENNVPVLRERDILSERDANSPCRRVYFVIQLMYVDEKNISEHHRLYWEIIREVLAAAPSSRALIDQMNEHILAGNHYQALKLAKQLIDYEQEVISRVH
ncbi:MAG TPA: flagellar biosynthesis repressor FlbT [Geobacterales bacterium]|jgi:flagellar protein FlbT|nr:flagellar biosynthesis repressor FlbT [Geobacterales bacterium]